MKCANGIYDGIPRLRMIHRALIVFLFLCAKEYHIYVLSQCILYSDYDRKDDMVRDSMVTTSVCNGPLFV